MISFLFFIDSFISLPIDELKGVSNTIIETAKEPQIAHYV